MTGTWIITAGTGDPMPGYNIEDRQGQEVTGSRVAWTLDEDVANEIVTAHNRAGGGATVTDLWESRAKSLRDELIASSADVARLTQEMEWEKTRRDDALAERDQMRQERDEYKQERNEARRSIGIKDDQLANFNRLTDEWIFRDKPALEADRDRLRAFVGKIEQVLNSGVGIEQARSEAARYRREILGEGREEGAG